MKKWNPGWSCDSTHATKYSIRGHNLYHQTPGLVFFLLYHAI